MEEFNVSTEKLLRSYSQIIQNDLKDNDTTREYFVPSGTKTSQIIKRARISLQVLVSHFSTSYQSQDDLKLDSKQQIYLLTTIQKFIISLLKSYTIQDFFDVILKNEEVDLRERYSEWKEFVGLICSIPERSANLMALDKSSRYKEESSFLIEANLFDKFTADSEFLIYNKSGKGDLEEDESKMLVFACEELFSKICRIGHSKILVQVVYSRLLNRLHNSTSLTYYKIWKNIISSFSSHTVELFLTAFLLHSQDLSKITNPISVEDKSRYLVRKVATLLSLLIEKDNNENASYLIKFKYFVGGKIFPISVVRVFCCFLSWNVQDQSDDMLRKIVGQIDSDNLKLKVNDDLTQLLKTLISSWSDPTFVKHASNSMQMYITSAILIIFGYLPKSTLIKAAISREITPGITRWLQNTSEESRKLGMVTAEVLSKLTDVSENVLDFGLNPEDEDVKYLRQLVELKDGIVYLPDVDYEDKIEADLNVERVPKESSCNEQVVNEFITHPNEVKSEGLAKIESGNRARVVDSDDEDDFVPYPMKEESDESDSDDEPMPQTKKKKILKPVYIIDLLSYLKASSDLDKLEIAMNSAEKLIREKTSFGTELDEHATELAKILIGLQDNFELKRFEENRHAAMVALICGSPKIAVPFIIQQFFEKRYSLAEKYMILSTLSTGARELAGLQAKKDIGDKKENSIMDTLSQEISKLNFTPIKTVEGTSDDKVRRFSRRPLIESMRTTSVNKFNELGAKVFFFPLTAGFWNLTRDRDHSSFMNDPTLVQRYITTLGVFVQCSTNTISLSRIAREYWDLMFSLRFFDDPSVISSILFGISVVLNTLAERELSESFGKELVETQQWVTTIFENKVNEQVQSMAAWVLVKIKEIVKEYQTLLMGNLLPLT